VIRKKRLTEEGIIEILSSCVSRTASRGQALELRSLGRKRNWVKGEKGRLINCPFRRTACFINNPLFGPQTQSGNSRVSPATGISAQPHPLSHTTPYQEIHIRVFLRAPPIPVLPHFPITRGINFLFSISVPLRRCRQSIFTTSPNRPLTHTAPVIYRSCHVVIFSSSQFNTPVIACHCQLNNNLTRTYETHSFSQLGLYFFMRMI
jgi:hypothetical protein